VSAFSIDRVHRERFLDDKTILALSKLQLQEALRVADLDGLVQCPFCDYAAICDDIEHDKEFRCQNPECKS
jgi:TRIAD3 protein (E3 ubiquitin-protein ligase RNF216)